MISRCSHRRYKKNFPFGRKSMPTMACKNCGKVIKPKDLIKKDGKA